MQIAYSQVADRLILRISTLDRQEYRFWLTRRFIKRLWPGLTQTISRQVRPEATHSPQARSAMMELMHESAVSQADFNTKYNNQVEAMPMGTEPVLVAKANLVPTKEGAVVLSLFPETGQGIELALDSNLLHALCKLFQDSLPLTDWDIKLVLGGTTTDSDPISGVSTNPGWQLH